MLGGFSFRGNYGQLGGGSGEGLGPLNVDRLVTLEGGRHEARIESEAVIHGKIQEEMIDNITNIVIIQELSR